MNYQEREQHFEKGGRTQLRSGRASGRFKIIWVALVALFVILLAAGVIPRLQRRAELSAVATSQSEERAIVNVMLPQAAPASNELVLPGTAQGIQDTAISARASGFVKRYLADIGDRVKAGQVLAELETPDLDQQVNQAKQEVEVANQDVAQAQQELEQSRATLERTKATLVQARANAELAQITLNRTKSLLESGVVTRQLIDEQQAIYNVRSADVGAAQAQIQEQQAAINAKQAMLKSKQSAVNARRSNLQRLMDLQGFRRVTAPYDGVITARGIEVGSLVSNNGTPVGTVGNAANAANAANNGIFRITRVEKMRFFVAVPQTYAPAIKLGQKVNVSVRELPDQQYEGSIAHTTQALDPATRTLPVTIHVENKGFRILPGMYAQVKFQLPGMNQNAVLVPGSALVTRAAGTQVITVRKDGTIHFEKVVVGRDYGSQIEILSGLSSDSQVVTNPTDALREGQKVQVSSPAKK